MPRLQRHRSRVGDIIIYDDATDSTRFLPLRIDTSRQAGFKLRWLPTEPGESGAIQVNEWTWMNGPRGAGTSIETPGSYEGGACEYGEFVWLRRLGVAQAAGALTELTLPTQAAAMTSGGFKAGVVYGANNDLYITTGGRSIVKVPNGTGSTTLTEQDCGAGAVTQGIAVFDGAGASRIYVADTANGIWEYDGSSWTEGEDGGAGALTRGSWLEVPYWTIGDELATGGEASNAGLGAHRLVMANATGTGFYHVSGDPQVSANWSALTTVGVGGTVFPINRTVASNRVVWFGTGRGVLGCNEVGYDPNYTKWVELIAAQNNCKVLAFWNELIWFATEMGLSAFRPSGERVDLPLFAQFGSPAGTTPIYGRPRALAPSPQGLYVGYYNAETTKSYIGCLVLDGESFRWSMAEAVIDNEEVTYLQQVTGSDGSPRLFIGTVDSSTGALSLYTQSLPKSGDPETDVLNSGPFRAATSWSLRLSRFNGGRAIPKTFRRFMLEADYLGDSYPNNTVDFQFSPDGGAFASQGTATDSPRWNAQPQSDYVRATNAQIKLEVANTTTAPVVIRSAAVRYSAHPELSKVLTVPVVFGEKTTNQDPRAVLTRLERAQRKGPLDMDDHLGRRVEGIVEPGIDEDWTLDPDGVNWTVHATVTISYARQITKFDVGDLFDVGEVFS